MTDLARRIAVRQTAASFALSREDDNPAIETARGDECPACRRYTLTTWLGGFADEPPALPHAECGECSYVE